MQFYRLENHNLSLKLMQKLDDHIDTFKYNTKRAKYWMITLILLSIKQNVQNIG